MVPSAHLKGLSVETTQTLGTVAAELRTRFPAQIKRMLTPRRKQAPGRWDLRRRDRGAGVVGFTNARRGLLVTSSPFPLVARLAFLQ